ncbi:MAG: NAD(P)-dependent oxidoreductase [Planctomycetota bacterium]|nr:NAD(P)-dependent oxidoreductase [Planctomycetota bacterium]
MEIEPGGTKVGWIGTGIMGSSMAGHLVEGGYSLRVHNRTPAKAGGLLEAGAEWADTPAACAADADVVFTIVGFPADVEEVHLGAAGVIKSVRAGTIVVDMTTSAPSLARKLAETYAAKEAASLDAPVSGGDVGAREGRLAIMVGGDAEAFQTVRPMLELMGENIAHMGPPGAGQHTKMCNQILIAGTIIGVCESLLYAAGSGLDSRAVIDIIGRGAAGCWSINNLGPRIVRRDFAPGFIVEHFIKDMGIALSEAKAMGLSLPGLALVERLYRDLADAGGGRDGTQALIKVLEKNSG